MPGSELLVRALIAAAALAGAVLVWALLARRARERSLRQLRSWWGRQPPGQPGATVARLLHDLRAEEDIAEGGYALDDRTWSDLDLDAVCERLDRCTSPVGSQVLYRMLRRPCHERVRRLQPLADDLARDPELRERLQLALLKLRHPQAARLAELLWRELPEPPRLSRLAPLVTAIALAVPVLAWYGVVSWGWLVPVFLLSSALHYHHNRRVDGLPLGQLGALAAAGQEIASLRDPRLDAVHQGLRPATSELARLRRCVAPLAMNDDYGLAQYLRIYLLADVLAYARVAALVRGTAGKLRAAFEALGEVDALLSVVSFAAEHPRVCRPSFCEQAQGWQAVAAWHPLLATPVANDYRPRPPAALVTGSNMAGKTTFLKVIGVNAVLAQSIDLACADAWSLPPLRVLTSIGRSDNLIEGRSYYLAEVESILRLVRAAQSAERHLFIADEVFRGTNPEERVAAAAEVLRHLGRAPHLVLAATHDHQLVELLADTYACYHFAETLSSEGLRFDFTIRPGPCTTRNAIALLEVMGYPADLVRRARAMTAGETRSGTPPMQ